MIDLYRFTKKEYAETLMEGKLYMNALGYFWNHGFESQKDIFEGLCQMQAERFDRSIENFGEYAVRIFDVDSFLCRLMDKAKSLGDYYLAGSI